MGGVVSVLLSRLVNLKPFPEVEKFITNHLDMQFNDVRAMMRLPLPRQGMTGGCNFAAAVVMCNLIQGAAKLLYSRPKGRTGKGDGFVALLLDYFPWTPRENKDEKADVLYDLVRNPLAHSLGVFLTPTQKGIPLSIAKGPLREPQLRRLERSRRRPPGLPAPISARGKRYTLDVTALYWATLEMMRRLAQDTNQMTLAVQRLRGLKVV